jgi:hypothetical protein
VYFDLRDGEVFVREGERRKHPRHIPIWLAIDLSILALSVILIAVGIVIGFEGIPLPQLLSIASP